MNQLKTLLRQAISTLAQAGCDTPRLDTEVIFAHLLNQERSWLYAHGDDLLSAATAQALAAAIQRRARREPVAYITGRREFFGLTFEVTPEVLIPRPETELLVEKALSLLGAGPALVVDVGTGSGCIAISLAVHRPRAKIVATDISPGALHVARRNARRHGVLERLRFIQADSPACLKGPFDLLVSNPPYIAAHELESLMPEVTHYEPRLALTDDGTGLSIVERILAQAPTLLKPGGTLLLEFGAAQGVAVLDLARANCPGAIFKIEQDLAGRDRLLVGRF